MVPALEGGDAGGRRAPDFADDLFLDGFEGDGFLDEVVVVGEGAGREEVEGREDFEFAFGAAVRISR